MFLPLRDSCLSSRELQARRHLRNVIYHARVKRNYNNRTYFSRNVEKINLNTTFVLLLSCQRGKTFGCWCQWPTCLNSVGYWDRGLESWSQSVCPCFCVLFHHSWALSWSYRNWTIIFFVGNDINLTVDILQCRMRKADDKKREIRRWKKIVAYYSSIFPRQWQKPRKPQREQSWCPGRESV
jgi:hypothetical protein